MEKQETTYISKLIPKDLLPLLLQQLWWKGFDEAQKKFPNEDASNVAVRRLIKGMFTEFDVDATRKQIETILIGHANDIGESDFADGKQHKKITNKAVDAVFSLITGETK